MPHISQVDRTVQETYTTLAPPAVLKDAVNFFAHRPNVYAAYVEQQGPTHITLRGQGGEEIVIAAASTDRGTRVTGSSYLFDQQVARFLSTLPTPSGTDATAVVTP